MPFVIFIYICAIISQISVVSSVKLSKHYGCHNFAFVSPSSPSFHPVNYRRNRNYATLSGIQPTGDLHIGNYVGCLEPCLKYQRNHNDLMLMIADNHALAGSASMGTLKDVTKSTVALALACGIDPAKTTVFLQSQLPQIMELSWILASTIKTEKFYKIAQFRNRNMDISQKSLATFLYPLLMSSDILTLNAKHIITGPDQKIHLKLARYIAKRLNKTLGSGYFYIPRFYFARGFRIRSLSDATRKMSKSDPSKMGTINFLDSDDDIVKKLRSAKTQCSQDEPSPEVKNLLRLLSLFSRKPYAEVRRSADLSNFLKLKNELATLIIDFLRPIRSKYLEIVDDTALLGRVLDESRFKLSPMLDARLRQIKRLWGYYGMDSPIATS